VRDLTARLFDNHRHSGTTEIQLLHEFIFGLLYEVRDGRLCSVFGGPVQYGTSGNFTFLETAHMIHAIKKGL
jgi:hypothetical protein